MRVAGISFVSIFLLSCAHPAARVECDFGTFMSAPYDHIIEQAPTTTLSEFQGRLETKPWQVGSDWVPGLDARIEIHGPAGLSEVLNVATDGTFARPRLPAGTYCYKISASGFRSMTGTTIVRPHASSRPLVLVLIVAE